MEVFGPRISNNRKFCVLSLSPSFQSKIPDICLWLRAKCRLRNYSFHRLKIDWQYKYQSQNPNPCSRVKQSIYVILYQKSFVLQDAVPGNLGGSNNWLIISVASYFELHVENTQNNKPIFPLGLLLTILSAIYILPPPPPCVEIHLLLLSCIIKVKKKSIFCTCSQIEILL